MKNELREPASRAAQFAPYESLRGYGDTVRESLFVPEERRSLPEDEAEELSVRLSQLKKGMKITVVYYCRDRYVTLTDTVRDNDTALFILILKKARIPFADIASVIILTV